MHETNSTSLAGEKEVTWESWRWGSYAGPLQSRNRELGTLKQLNIRSSNEMPPLLRPLKTKEFDAGPVSGFPLNRSKHCEIICSARFYGQL